jgi:hypothetical protein
MTSKMTTRGSSIVLFLALTFVILAWPSFLMANQSGPKAKTFAQRLVDQTKAAHPEADEIGISVRSARGCRTIASTDPTDIGEACEKDDLAPMQTGKPYVEKERDGYDVSVPLRDAHGRLIGSLGVGFKRQSGQTQAQVTSAAEKISKEIASRISSKAELSRPAK